MKVYHNRTKIVATLGPASASKEVLLKMIKAGMDICRINFSHGKHEDLAKIIATIREINKKHNTHVGILADLQGPKIRVGEMTDNGVFLKKNQELVMTTKPCVGTHERLYISYQAFPKDVKVGEIILLDDGKLQFKVISTNKKDSVKVKVIYGGVLSSNKGVNLPDTKVSIPSLTPKDLKDLDFILKQEVEWVGLSFVREAKDIFELKEIIKKKNSKTRVIAKIEKPEALKNLDEIIAVTDAVMVARGDLGVECPMEDLPIIQKQIVKKCMEHAKPVIIATQMMESMITNPRPTRAEVNDVANSVLDGADAVMLSGETSVGQYPVEVIQSMQQIIRKIENTAYPYMQMHVPNKKSSTYKSDSICYTACILAEHNSALGIVSMTHSGYTAFRISSHRPEAITFIFTSNKSLLCLLSLVWGVRGFYYDKFESTDQTMKDVNGMLKHHKLVKKGDVVINTASTPIGRSGRTNTIKISQIE
ncbi:MAG: pyruvate kinase [bacterium]|jgi:pyruvate kinase